tara:strand:- start:2550 stop:4079 length:1530 start_codon:yes stop_codon:yes gene_type:complete
MAQARQNIYIGAPGFKGLNTQDSLVNADPAFASVAENAIIDKYGRIGARKGIDLVTNSATPLGSSNGIESIGEFIALDGAKKIYSAGNNKIFSGTATLTDETPGSYTVSANNWKMVNFNDHMYFFQQSHEPLVYQDGGTLEKMSVHAGASGTPPQANEALAAFGRLWVSGFANDGNTLQFSDSLDGTDWNTGSSGTLNVRTVWPTGYDEITALASYNNFLVIFGKRSILMYTGAGTPSSMTLADTIVNVGCIARDSVQHTGTDIIFLSDTGVRSLGRTIQEKSVPMTDVSKNVRDTLLYDISAEATLPIKSAYSPEESFYLLFLPTSKKVYCFDTRAALEDGSLRATIWPVVTTILSGLRASDGTLYFGNVSGINKYNDYLDDTSTYRLKYYTNPMSFGDATRLKILKEISLTIVGGQNSTVSINWGYDHTESYNKQTFTLASSNIAEYGVSEYNVSSSEYNSSIIIDTARIKPNKSGNIVTIGVEAVINQGALSLQELNTQALIGRMI